MMMKEMQKEDNESKVDLKYKMKGNIDIISS